MTSLFKQIKRSISGRKTKQPKTKTKGLQELDIVHPTGTKPDNDVNIGIPITEGSTLGLSRTVTTEVEEEDQKHEDQSSFESDCNKDLNLELLENSIMKSKKQILKDSEKIPLSSVYESVNLSPKLIQSQKIRNYSLPGTPKIEYVSNIFPQPPMVTAKGTRPFRILAIDGGGVRGIIPASILRQLEVEAGLPISEMFDLVAGTSTGAILSSMLVLPESPGSTKPKFTADDGVKLYIDKCPEIFKTSIYRKVKTLSGLASAMYSNENKEKVLDEYVGDAKISDLLVDLLVPTFDIREGKPYFFKSSKARREGSRCDYKIKDVLNATSCAPTYFPPHKVEGYDAPKEHGYRSFLDGALTANSPALCALAEAYRHYGADPSNTVLVSLGCGSSDVGVEHDVAKKWGGLNWAPYFPNVMLSSSVNTVHYQLAHVIPPAHYFRIQSELPYDKSGIDTADPAHLQWLADHGSSVASSCRPQLAHLAQILKELRPTDGRRIPTVEQNVATPDQGTLPLPLVDSPTDSPWSPPSTALYA